jgi:hypothetical protein
MGSASSISKHARNKKSFISPPPDMDGEEIGTIFAKEMYVNSTSKVESLQQVLADESGRNAFLKFLRTEYADNNLQFYMVQM